MAVTIKDIAKRTNLSLGTISNYLNGQKIREKNKLDIESAIKELNYSVNEFGRNLKTNKSATIGIIMPFLDDPYAAKIASFITRILRRNNFAVIVSDTNGEECEKDVIRFMIRKRVEGVIAFPVDSQGKYYKLLDDYKIPYVFIDRVIENFNADTIILGNEDISKEAVDLAISKGHRKIGVLVGAETTQSARERLSGYIKALKGANIEIEERYIKRGVYNDHESSIRLACELLEQSDPPTLIFATNYFFTLGAIVACNEFKLQLGEDISLIGFDNIMITEFIRPKICMVCQPMTQYAELSVKLLLGKINGEESMERGIHVCKGYIMEGESVKNINAARN